MKIVKLFTCLFFLIITMTSKLFAQTSFLPESIIIDSKKAVFIDIQSISSTITFDVFSKKALVKSKIRFRQFEKGFPLFDLVPNPSKVFYISSTKQRQSASAQLIQIPEISESKKTITQMRLLALELAPGEHEVIIYHKINKNLIFKKKSLKSAFWMSDLKERFYSEQYLPSNLLYDQYKLDLEVKIENSPLEHIIYSNGDLRYISLNHYKLSFPAYFNTSSFYFHLTAKNSFKELKGRHTSIDRRVINITVYGNEKLKRFLKKAKKVLKELEKDYGPFPHDKLIIFATSQKGGMEYAGATMTGLSALGHEILHSYFGRSAMPANGRSGWIDEAIASWRDSNYSKRLKPTAQRFGLGHDLTRSTTRLAYTHGKHFLSHLNQVVIKKQKVPLKSFLREFHENYKYKIFSDDIFQKKLESFYNLSFETLFRKYVRDNPLALEASSDCPYRLSNTQLSSHL